MSRPRPRRVVYLSYDGLAEPLGQSQILPYLRGLARFGHQFHVLSFEKPGAPTHLFEQLEPGIRWTALRYHKTPTVPATAFDSLQGFGSSAAAALLARADLVHVRSYLPGAMSLPLILGARRPLLFDTRGLWADEKVDGGVWPKDGALYRGAKQVERLLFSIADAVTVLSTEFLRWLREDYAYRQVVRGPIHVIPTCTDLEMFHPRVAPDPEVRAWAGEAPVLSYIGSFGGRYLSTDVGRFFLEFRAASGGKAKLLVASRDRPDEIRAVVAAAGLEQEMLHISVPRERVAAVLRASSASVFFICQLPSTLACAPTKTGEILGCGIPLAANAIADIPRILGSGDVGVVVQDFDQASLQAEARRLYALAMDPATEAKARRTAERWFSLDRAVEAYDALYAALPARHGHPTQVGDRSWP